MRILIDLISFPILKQLHKRKFHRIAALVGRRVALPRVIFILVLHDLVVV